jgi:hypothetical protein
VKNTNYDPPHMQNSTFLCYFLRLKYFPLHLLLNNTSIFSLVEEKATTDNQKKARATFCKFIAYDHTNGHTYDHTNGHTYDHTNFTRFGVTGHAHARYLLPSQIPKEEMHKSQIIHKFKTQRVSEEEDKTANSEVPGCSTGKVNLSLCTS